MSADNKHLAALLLGAAAAFGAYEYSNLTPEEKEAMRQNLKKTFDKVKAEAESGAENAKDYFNDLKGKAVGLLKDHFPNAEKHIEDLFAQKQSAEPPTQLP